MRHDRVEKLFWGCWLAYIVGIVAGLGVIGYVAYHFITKLW